MGPAARTGRHPGLPARIYPEMAGRSRAAAFVIDGAGNLRHVELVPEIGQEPNYEAILAAARG